MRTMKKLSKLTKAYNSGIASVKTFMRNKSEVEKKNADAQMCLAKQPKRMVDT